MKLHSPSGKTTVYGSGFVTTPDSSSSLPTSDIGSNTVQTDYRDTSLSITIKNGVAAISGKTTSCEIAQGTATIVAGLYGVRRVINLLSVNSNH